jgi:hypothetical protein
MMPLSMSRRNGQKLRPFSRQAVVGLAIAASTVSADLANLSGHPDASQLVLVSLAGLCAAVAAIVTLDPQKKYAGALKII